MEGSFAIVGWTCFLMKLIDWVTNILSLVNVTRNHTSCVFTLFEFVRPKQRVRSRFDPFGSHLWKSLGDQEWTWVRRGRSVSMRTSPRVLISASKTIWMTCGAIVWSPWAEAKNARKNCRTQWCQVTKRNSVTLKIVLQCRVNSFLWIPTN